VKTNGRALRKPRKRRVQTIAEKGAASERYAWKEMFGRYTLKAPAVDADIAKLGEGWTMVVVIGGQRFLGNRPTLEAAYKATSDLLFKHAKKIWLKEDATVIMAPWKGRLDENI
jgi:hypothetical protein